MGLRDPGFEDVDRADAPEERVAYLDAVTRLDGARAYKRRSYEALGAPLAGRVLDVGCGAGDDLRELAALVGPSGRVVGVDSSEAMVAEARARTRGLPVDCRVGDAQILEFAAGDFDGCRADRVLQHVADPQRALAELVRVARHGAGVVVCDTDWGSLLVAGGEPELTRRIVGFRCDRVRNGWIGRQLPGMARQAGLTDLTIEPVTWVSTELTASDPLLELSAAAVGAADAGIVSHEAAARWMAELQQSDAGGQFLSALTLFIVSGRKP